MSRSAASSADIGGRSDASVGPREAAVPTDGSRLALRLTVNGRPVAIQVPADRLLIDLLRVDLGLTGTKEGCGVGVCGACSIIVDGLLYSSCIVLAAAVNGADIRTIEGIAGPNGELSPVQEAFIRCGGYQCGICTPGHVVAATALLEADPSPSRATIEEWMAGNLCRCTGYRQIIEAVEMAANGAADGDRAVGSG
jgi:carbon-monoxide dehydrogenase small subunit